MYSIADDVEFETVGEETLILKASTNTFYKLNGVATFIWQRLDKPFSEIVQEITHAYNVEAHQVMKDVEMQINLLRTKQLIIKSIIE